MNTRNVGYKFRFKPSYEQANHLAKAFGCARFVYNHCLRMRSLAFKRRKEKFNYISLSKHLTYLKKTTRYRWLNEIAACVLVQSLIDLDNAFNRFFKKIAKYPRFKKKTHNQHIRYQLDQRIIHNNYLAGKMLKIPKLGNLAIKWSKIPQGIPKMVTLIKTSSNKYYVSFSCEEVVVYKNKTQQEVGVDVGVKDVVVTSNGYFSSAPKYYYKNARKLRSAQRALSRKTKGSRRYDIQRIKVACIYEKVANCRKDFLHKETTELITTNDVIYLEYLNIQGMLKNRKLSKAIADVGLYELKRQLVYKAQWYGKEVIIIDRFTPTTAKCSNCHVHKKVSLSERAFNCEYCGLVLNRDLNAAINIKEAGIVSRGATHPLGTMLA